ncbi:MAG TPA: hypothetical protein VF032_12600 [Thermoleophilaceae bacterium]
MKRLLAFVATVLALPAAATAAPVGLHVSPHTVGAGKVIHVSGNVGNGCAHKGSVTVISAALHPGHEFAGVNAIFIHIRPSGNFFAKTRIPSTRAPGAYHVGARCGGGSFGNITLHVT